MSPIVKTKAALRKNLPWLKALLFRKFPPFVYGSKKINQVPVFVFHQVDQSFEHCLRYLTENDYHTLSCSVLHFDNVSTPPRCSEKNIILTFDDGDISLGHQAYPLLKKYNQQAVSFICPGLVPEPSLDQLKNTNSLCDWNQIITMHNSGAIDFQLHGMYHDLVFTSPLINSFFHPNFRSPYFGKQEKATVVSYGDTISLTNIWPREPRSSSPHLGMPIYSLSPKFASDQRYLPRQKTVDHLQNFVIDKGGERYFQQKGWRKKLNQEYISTGGDRKGEIICGTKYQEEIAKDLITGQGIMENRLPGKKVRHFCFPWYKYSVAALNTVGECGFTTSFLGPEVTTQKHNWHKDNLTLVQRLPGHYIYLLPGKGHQSLLQNIAQSL